MTTAPAAPTEADVYAAAWWPALGTYAQLVVAGPEFLARARAEAERVLAAVDLACSRFRPDSDLVRANRAAGAWVRVHPLLVAALGAALAGARDTDGLVDPTLGGPLEELGYDRDFAQLRHAVPTGPATGPATVPAVLPGVDSGMERGQAWREVGVDPEGAVRVPKGFVLDLGAVGKAFAADLVASSVARSAGADCVVSLGGDVAVGATPDSPGHRWQVAVAEAPGDAPAQLVVIERGGLATSTTTHRRWLRRTPAGIETVHHLLDPRTGRPVQPVWRTASVAAASCVAANTATTAALVLGAAAPQWLAGRDLPARLVAADGGVRVVGSWPEGGAA